MHRGGAKRARHFRARLTAGTIAVVACRAEGRCKHNGKCLAPTGNTLSRRSGAGHCAVGACGGAALRVTDMWSCMKANDASSPGRATRDEIVREPEHAAANHCNSGTELSAIVRTYKCGADLLDDRKNSLLEPARRRVEEPFSALDEEIVRDETKRTPIDLTILVDDRA
jgi:hypothetical protein